MLISKISAFSFHTISNELSLGCSLSAHSLEYHSTDEMSGDQHPGHADIYYKSIIVFSNSGEVKKLDTNEQHRSALMSKIQKAQQRGKQTFFISLYGLLPQ